MEVEIQSDIRASPTCDLAVLVGDNVYEVGIETPGAAAWVDAFATPMAPSSRASPTSA